MEKQTRNTKQRTVILNTLRGLTSHPTADEIFALTRKTLPKISLGTVYRNLELLARQGDIVCLENGSSRKRFDGDTRPHHHVRCLRCGKIGDVHTPVAAPQIDALHVPGFTIVGSCVMFEGLCDRCTTKTVTAAS